MVSIHSSQNLKPSLYAHAIWIGLKWGPFQVRYEHLLWRQGFIQVFIYLRKYRQWVTEQQLMIVVLVNPFFKDSHQFIVFVTSDSIEKCRELENFLVSAIGLPRTIQLNICWSGQFRLVQEAQCCWREQSECLAQDWMDVGDGAT